VTARWNPLKGTDFEVFSSGKIALPSEAAPSICSVTPVMKLAPG